MSLIIMSTPLCMSHPVWTGLINCLVVVLFLSLLVFSFTFLAFDSKKH